MGTAASSDQRMVHAVQQLFRLPSPSDLLCIHGVLYFTKRLLALDYPQAKLTNGRTAFLRQRSRLRRLTLNKNRIYGQAVGAPKMLARWTLRTRRMSRDILLSLIAWRVAAPLLQLPGYLALVSALVTRQPRAMA
jgi:hypothetical protein